MSDGFFDAATVVSPVLQVSNAKIQNAIEVGFEYRKNLEWVQMRIEINKFPARRLTN